MIFKIYEKPYQYLESKFAIPIIVQKATYTITILYFSQFISYIILGKQ